MSRRLEFHREHAAFFQAELEKLAGEAVPLTWEGIFAVLSEQSNPRFDGVVAAFCSGLEWPPIPGLDLARACARLHFALWHCHRLPWEVMEPPVTGTAYLRLMLIDRYWEHRQRWLMEAWAGWDDEGS